VSRQFRHADVKEGDRVKCNVRGREFYASVRSRLPAGYGVDPETGSYYQVTKRQVTEHLPANPPFDPSTTQVTTS
jgi:hypothetical protein